MCLVFLFAGFDHSTEGHLEVPLGACELAPYSGCSSLVGFQSSFPVVRAVWADDFLFASEVCRTHGLYAQQEFLVILGGHVGLRVKITTFNLLTPEGKTCLGGQKPVF